MILTKGKKDDQFLVMFRQHDFKMKKLPPPHLFFSKWRSVSTLAIKSQKHALLVEVYSSRAILHQTEPSLIPMFRLGFIWEVSARFLRSKKGKDPGNEFWREIRETKQTSRNRKILTFAQPAYRDPGWKNWDLGNWASPPSRINERARSRKQGQPGQPGSCEGVHWICFLLSFNTNSKAAHGLKLE